MQLQQTAFLAACLAALASGVAADKCTLDNAVNSPAQLDNEFKKFGAAVMEVAMKIAPVEITTGKLTRRQLGSEVPLDCK